MPLMCNNKILIVEFCLFIIFMIFLFFALGHHLIDPADQGGQADGDDQGDLGDVVLPEVAVHGVYGPGCCGLHCLLNGHKRSTGMRLGRR